jgi:hypothetical protein
MIPWCKSFIRVMDGRYESRTVTIQAGVGS